jgi:hypothetical protein
MRGRKEPSTTCLSTMASGVLFSSLSNDFVAASSRKTREAVYGTDSEGTIVIAAYKPKPSKYADLLQLTR